MIAHSNNHKKRNSLKDSKEVGKLAQSKLRQFANNGCKKAISRVESFKIPSIKHQSCQNSLIQSKKGVNTENKSDESYNIQGQENSTSTRHYMKPRFMNVQNNNIVGIKSNYTLKNTIIKKKITQKTIMQKKVINIETSDNDIIIDDDTNQTIYSKAEGMGSFVPENESTLIKVCKSNDNFSDNYNL